MELRGILVEGGYDIRHPCCKGTLCLRPGNSGRSKVKEVHKIKTSWLYGSGWIYNDLYS
jgi:hypothetical protein